MVQQKSVGLVVVDGPYTPTIVTTPTVPATEDSPAVPEQTTVETVMNMTPENRAHFESEKEAIHLILTGIGDEIYSTVDACQTTQEMWEAIERLQQVNELRAERMAKNANPLALVATAQTLQDPYYQTSKPHKSYAPTSKASLPTRSHATTVQRHKNVDTTPRYKNDNQTGQFRNQRAVNVVGARETVGGPVVQQSGIQCFNCKEFGHYAKECRSQPGTTLKPLETVETGDSNVTPDSPDMCDNDIQDDQNDVECDDERVALANLIANLKLDVDENKKIQKQLKKSNATLTQELTECKSILAETSRTLGESNSIRDSCLVALQNKQTEFERYKAFNDRTVDYETLGLLAQKEIDIKEGLKVKAYEISVVKEKHDELVKTVFFTKYITTGLVKEKTRVITDLKLKSINPTISYVSNQNALQFTMEDPTFCQSRTCLMTLALKTRMIVLHLYMKSEQELNADLKTSNINAVCATCGKCVFNLNHDACFSKFLKDVNARTKKPNVVPISTRKPKSQANKSVTTPNKKTVASESTITSSKSYYRMLNKRNSKAWKWWIAQQCPSAYT
ncbi:retrovirus-related pol polyprotein from transposon TNT 1-94 [Tanacetum coccineum]